MRFPNTPIHDVCHLDVVVRPVRCLEPGIVAVGLVHPSGDADAAALVQLAEDGAEEIAGSALGHNVVEGLGNVDD